MVVPSYPPTIPRMSFKKHISLLKEALAKKESILLFDTLAKKLAQDIVESADSNKLILIFGNGGSAADSSHWSSELVASYENRKRPPLPVISLADSLSTITAIANDTNYKNVFKRQVDAYGYNLGLAIGLSTSGQSENVLNALDKAQTYNAKTVLLTGLKYETKNRFYNEIIFNSFHVGTIQTLTQIFYHSVCKEVENIII